MAFTAVGKNPLIWSPEAEIDLLRSICLRGMLRPSRDSLLGKVRDVRWRVITAEMRGWGWGFSLRSIRLQWEASLQPRLDQILSEGKVHLPVGSTREQRIALLGGPWLAQIDGVHNDLPKPREPTPFDGDEDETAAVPPTDAANANANSNSANVFTPSGGFQPTEEEHAFYRDMVPPENLGLTVGVQKALLAKFGRYTVEELLGARALMTDLLDACHRACAAAVDRGLHPGPAYHLRHQLHYIHLAWSRVLDRRHRPLTERQYDAIRACEVAEKHMLGAHCNHDRLLREWRLLGLLPPSLLGPQQTGLLGQQQTGLLGQQPQQSYVPPPPPPPPPQPLQYQPPLAPPPVLQYQQQYAPPPAPAQPGLQYQPYASPLPNPPSSSPYTSPFKLGTEETPLGHGYPAMYQAVPFPGGGGGGTWPVQQPAPAKTKKAPNPDDDDGFWDETESDSSPKNGAKKRVKKVDRKPEEQAAEQEGKRGKQNEARQERAARRLRRKEGLE